MSKELQAFRKICQNLNSYEFTDEYKKNKELIETALKEYEEIINTGWKNIPTNLQFLSKILDEYLPNSDTLKDLEKSLKAFEIIKEKKVNVALLMNCFKWPDDPSLLKANPTMCKGLHIYNSTYEKGEYWREPLDISEYNLLKEVLL